jgi:hypothetical protein
MGCFIGILIQSNYENPNSVKINVISSPDNGKKIIIAETSALLDMYVSIYEYADENRNIIHRIYDSAHDPYYDKNNYYYHIEDELYSIEWKENGLILDFFNYKDKSIENRIYLDYDY